MQKRLLTHALALGVGILLALGVQTAGALRASTPEAEVARVEQLLEEYRQLWLALGTDFRPEGYRLLGEPPDPLSSYTSSVPLHWYKPDGMNRDWILLHEYSGQTIQRSLAWAHDDGAAIVVHILFTTQDLGRGGLANAVGNHGLRDRSVVFRPDWHFIGVRDNLIFCFQLLPLDKTWAGTSYPRAWLVLIDSFVGDVRKFLDARDLRR
ncbi:MAG: hypothetical protein AB1492_05815 [Bacillota bacterium]